MLPEIQHVPEFIPLLESSRVETIDFEQLKIAVCKVAQKILATIALTFTNSLLTITVSVMKLTGVTIITPLVLGWLTKPLHTANLALSKYAYTPFRIWAETLSEENTRIIETEKVIGFANNKILFYPRNYLKHSLDSVKAVLAPVSLTLSVANAVLWLAFKTLWVSALPGITGQILITLPFALNKEISHFTYHPLKEIADKMFDFHWERLKKALINI